MTDVPLDATESELVTAALAVRSNAFAPYSRFLVGAALRTADGHIFTGVNVENASYGLTLCAERVAVGAAVSSGHRTFSHAVIASQGGVSPCGACRQVFAQFGGDMQVLLVDVESIDAKTDATERGAPERGITESQIRRFTLSDLLPAAFHFDGPRESTE